MKPPAELTLERYTDIALEGAYKCLLRQNYPCRWSGDRMMALKREIQRRKRGDK